jgi:hypothetical protein
MKEIGLEPINFAAMIDDRAGDSRALFAKRRNDMGFCHSASLTAIVLAFSLT